MNKTRIARAALLLLGLFVHLAATAQVRIPPEHARYRRLIQTEAVRLLGVKAPVARITARFHQESRFRPDARSHVGATGLGQFMPATAADMAKFHATECAPADPLSAAWSIRCAILYDRSLIAALRPFAPVATVGRADAARMAELSDCTKWAFGLSSYNGGAGWLNRDRKLAQASGSNPNLWFRQVEAWSNRSSGAWRENRDYVRRIMLEIEPAYIAAGVPGELCHGEF
jgi:Transglycosylase SLT domain